MIEMQKSNREKARMPSTDELLNLITMTALSYPRDTA